MKARRFATMFSRAAMEASRVARSVPLVSERGSAETKTSDGCARFLCVEGHENALGLLR